MPFTSHTNHKIYFLNKPHSCTFQDPAVGGAADDRQGVRLHLHPQFSAQCAQNPKEISQSIYDVIANNFFLSIFCFY